VYGRNGDLNAVPFDLESRKVTGTPSRVLEGIVTVDVNGSANYELSRDGSLAYLPAQSDGLNYEHIWIDRDGNRTSLNLEKEIDNYFNALVPSPDGTRIVGSLAAANDKIWVHDLRRNSTSRLSITPGNDNDPIWTADSKYIAYSNDRKGNRDVYWIPADGSAPATLILDSPFDEFPASFSPDARYLAYELMNAEGNSDIWIRSMDESGETRPLLDSPEYEFDASFSPDGSWIAYAAGDWDEEEIYVRPFPGPGNAIRISTTGGFAPEWSADGSELFYLSEDGMMAVPIEYAATLNPGQPYVLFRRDPTIAAPPVPSPDGNRFLTLQFDPEAAKLYEIRMVFDWTERLKAIR
jgi:Tol biopolymer transport system component